MVVDLFDEEVNLFDDADESEPNDLAMFDSGTAPVVIGTPQLKKLLKALSLKGCDLSTIPAWRCEKGMRFRNGRDVTSLCVLVPTYFKGKRRDVLMYVLDCYSLSTRPALEVFGISTNYKAKQIAWGEGQKLEPATL